jgi:Fe-S-cluster-containing dehydrogenase component
MDNRDQDRGHNRSQFEKLVCVGMGYCCPYAFFRVNKRTGAIATRLGQTPRTIRLWKAKFNAGELKCGKLEACMKQQLIDGGK